MAPALLFRSAEAALKLGRADEARDAVPQGRRGRPQGPLGRRRPGPRRPAGPRAARYRRRAGPGRVVRRPVPRQPAAGRRPADRGPRGDGGGASPRRRSPLLTASLAEDKPGPATAQSQRYYLGLAYRADGQPAKASEVLDALAKTPAAPVAADAQFLRRPGARRGRGGSPRRSPPWRSTSPTSPRATSPTTPWRTWSQARLEAGRARRGRPGARPARRAVPQEQGAGADPAAAGRGRAGRQAVRPRGRAVPAGGRGGRPGPRRRGRGWGWAGPCSTAASRPRPPRRSPPCSSRQSRRPARPRGRPGPRPAPCSRPGRPSRALAAYALAAEKYPEPSSGHARRAGPRPAPGRGRSAGRGRRSVYEQFVKDHPDPKAEGACRARRRCSPSGAGRWSTPTRPTEADQRLRPAARRVPRQPPRRRRPVQPGRIGLPGQELRRGRPRCSRRWSPRARRPRPGSSSRPCTGSAGPRPSRSDWPAAAKTLDRLIAEFPDSPFRREARFLRAEVALEAGDAATAEAGFAGRWRPSRAAPTDPAGFVPARPPPPDPGPGRPEEMEGGARGRRRVQGRRPRRPADLPRSTTPGAGPCRADSPRFDEARAAYQARHRRPQGGRPGRPRPVHDAAKRIFHQKNYHEAIREFLKVDILYDAPPWQAAALLEAGKVYEQLDQWADAAETYERLCSKFPDDPSAAEAKPARRRPQARDRVVGDREHLGALEPLIGPHRTRGGRHRRIFIDGERP